ncbi:MAG: aldo/keto reductase [Chlorobi bacterium]|nr:aldo/keto reductase [Chlorobiota bacterium]
MKKQNKLSRREFIQDSSKAALALSAAGFVSSCSFLSGKDGKKYKIPRRKLGKTGLAISIVSFGGGTQFLDNNDGEWEKILEAAVEGGINLFDTAPSYYASKFYQIGDGKSLDSSEERFGRILPAFRDKIILSTKLETRSPEEAKKELESSLKKMKTDYIDILMIHGISKSDKIIDIEEGLYKTMARFKESGIVKNIGFSSMEDAQHAAGMLEKQA